MPTFTAAFREAVYPRNAETIPFFKVAWPTGTEYYCDRPLGFDSLGPFLPRILSIEEFTYNAGLQVGQLEGASTNVVLEDIDGRLRRIIEGAVLVAGSVASCGWLIKGLAESDWHVALAGIIGKPSYGPGTVSIPLRTQDAPIAKGTIPKAQILQAEAPLSIEASRGLYHRILAGIHDASALTGRGMVPCPNWQSGGAGLCRFVLCLGVAKSVDRVYLNGALQTFSSDYAVSYPIIGGKKITSIDFVADVAADAVVTADAQGYETVGDGSGELILNPVDQFLHRLANFTFGDWRHGEWLDPADYPIDLGSFAGVAAFASTMGFEGTGVPAGGTAEARDAMSDFKDWLESWLPMRAFWTERGSLALGAFSHIFPGYDIPGPGQPGPSLLVRGYIHELGDSFKVTAEQTVLRRVDLSALFGIQDAKFWTSLVVQDVSQPEESGDAHQLSASAAHLI